MSTIRGKFWFPDSENLSDFAPAISACNEFPTMAASCGIILSASRVCKKIAGLGLRTPKSAEIAMWRGSKYSRRPNICRSSIKREPPHCRLVTTPNTNPRSRKAANVESVSVRELRDSGIRTRRRFKDCCSDNTIYSWEAQLYQSLYRSKNEIWLVSQTLTLHHLGLRFYLLHGYAAPG